MINANSPAMPVVNSRGTGDYGLTKREYFAGLAMQSIITSLGGGPDDVAENSVAFADALLARLEQSK